MILTILASKLSENEISFLGQVFNNIDKNKDGILNLQELIEGFRFLIEALRSRTSPSITTSRRSS